MPPFKLHLLSLALISLHSLAGMATAQAQDVATDAGDVQSLAPVVVSASKRGETLDQLNGAASVADRLALDDARLWSWTGSFPSCTCRTARHSCSPSSRCAG